MLEFLCFVQCVKALIYINHMYALLNVNDANDAGDTPLHLAAKWGYGKKFRPLMFQD